VGVLDVEGVVGVLEFVVFSMIFSIFSKKIFILEYKIKKIFLFYESKGVLCEASYTVEDPVGVGTAPFSVKPRLRFLARFFFTQSSKRAMRPIKPTTPAIAYKTFRNVSNGDDEDSSSSGELVGKTYLVVGYLAVG
jgi:hypothetical protein